MAWFAPATSDRMYLFSVDDVLQVEVNSGTISVRITALLGSSFISSGASLPSSVWSHVALTVQFTGTAPVTAAVSILVNGSLHTVSTVSVTSAVQSAFASAMNSSAYRLGACYTAVTATDPIIDSPDVGNRDYCDFANIFRGLSNPNTSNTSPLNETAFVIAYQQLQLAYQSLAFLIDDYFSNNAAAYSSWQAQAGLHTAATYQSLYAAATADAAQVLVDWNWAVTNMTADWPWMLTALAQRSPFGFFTGAMDELLLLNMSLSAAQVASFMQTPIQAINCLSINAATLNTTAFAQLCPLLPHVSVYVPFNQWVVTAASPGPASIGSASFFPAEDWALAPLMASTGPLCYAVNTAQTGGYYPTLHSSLDSAVTECAAGSMSAAGDLLCYLCPPGTAAPSAGSTTCTICAVNTTSPVGAASCWVPNHPSQSNYSTLEITPALLTSSTVIQSPSPSVAGFTSPYPYISFSHYAPPGANVTLVPASPPAGCTSNCCQSPQNCGGGGAVPFPPPFLPPFPPLPPPCPPFPPGLCSHPSDPDKDDDGCDLKPGYSGASPCDICSPGYFSQGEEDEECLPCAVGQYCSEEGCEECSEPEQGYYTTVDGEASDGEEEATGQTEAAEGYYTVNAEREAASSNAVNQVEVQAGYYAANSVGNAVTAGAVQEVACGAGQYQPSKGQTVCLNCSSGEYQPGTGSISCLACPEGNFSAADGHPHTQCLLCNNGTHQPSSGQAACQLCQPGSYPSAPLFH